MLGQYFATAFSCSSGEHSPQRTGTTALPVLAASRRTSGAGATFVAINASNGTSYGSGTITASTSNVSSGANFTLSGPLAARAVPPTTTY